MTPDTKSILEILGKLDKGFSRLENCVFSLKEDLSLVKEDVSVLKEDVSGLKEDVSDLKEDVSGLKEDVSGLKEDVSGLKEDVSGLKEDVSGLKEDVSGLKADFYRLENKVNRLEMILENETNRNIRIIAEGHLDLSRKLHEALKVEAEKELLLIRVTALETDVRNIKNQLNQSA